MTNTHPHSHPHPLILCKNRRARDNIMEAATEVTLKASAPTPNCRCWILSPQP